MRKAKILFLLVGMIGNILMLAACDIRPDSDPYHLDEQLGEMEIVIPAEHYIFGEAAVSPGGTWLLYTYRSSENQETYTSLLNIPENKLYDRVFRRINGGEWVDDNHISREIMWRLSDMTYISVEKIELESVAQGKNLLAEADQLFLRYTLGAVEIISTNYDFPYLIEFIPSKLGCELDFWDCVNQMLPPNQTITEVLPSRQYSAPYDPIYSPDGKYYVQMGRYPNDPTDSFGGQGVQLFKAGETTPIVYGFRYGWNATFLGWANDSSGAYVFYSPVSSTGDALRSAFPIRKYLVPGAEPRGLPTIVTPVATPQEVTGN